MALLPAGGCLGVWLVHCRIGKSFIKPRVKIAPLIHTPFTAWHASSRLALQILERQHEIEPTIGSLEAKEQTCQGSDTSLAKKKATYDHDDSGI